MQQYETLKQVVAELDTDLPRALGGNKAAGTRIRKKLQQIKALAQQMRTLMLEARENEPPDEEEEEQAAQ